MNMKKIITITIASLLVLGIFAGAAVALDKEEVVYVNLSASGDVKDVYVVNIFEPEESQYLVDYGDYNSVKNLVSTETIVQNGDENKVFVDAGRFFYQGNLGAVEIPWNIKITYMLDGRVVQPDFIAGKSGHVKIILDISKNPNFQDTYFYKNLGVQATVALNATDCWNIVAPGAVVANNGKNKQLSYTILPNKGGVYNIDFDTINFEMQSINFNGIILNLDIKLDLTDAKNMMRTLENATSSLSKGANEINSGASSLKASTTGISVYSERGDMLSAWVDYINKNYGPYGVNPIIEEITVSNCTSPNSYIGLGDGKVILSDTTDPRYQAVLYLYSGCKLLNSFGTLESGISTLAYGTSTLASGASILASSTDGLDSSIQSMVDKILEPIKGGDGYIRSFTSIKNVDVKSIQFAMHTDPINMSDEVVVEKVVKELSLWDKILQFFGLYKEE